MDTGFFLFLGNMENQTNLYFVQDIQKEIKLTPVGSWLRFVNYLIDVILFYCIVFIVGGLIGVAAVTAGQDAEIYVSATNNVEALLLQYLVSFILFITIYTISEGTTKGKTLGKLITGTRAIKKDGNHITWRDALLRSLSRVVPFEPFSAFGGFPWHDTWTNTIVMKERK